MAVLALTAGLGFSACSDSSTGPTLVTVKITLNSPVAVRPGLNPTSPGCVSETVVTKIYPSWRGFNAVTMSALLALDGWESTFTDVPVNQQVRFRLNDKNWCDRNSTGTVLADVAVNGVQLAQNAMTPGPTGDQPGFQFTVDSSGRISQ